MHRFTLEVSTDGNCDIINLNPGVTQHIRDIKADGIVHLFVGGSTAALTAIEYENGLVKHDLPNIIQKLIPDSDRYEHEATWNDDNGHSHIRAALVGPDLSIPFSNGKLLTGEYQQIVLIDFDTRPRRRKIIGSIMT